jgi:membrane associated rhomboid family serine protease
LLLTLLIIGLYALQSRYPDQEALHLQYGLSTGQAGEGARFGLVTSLFVHGNWAHAVLNAVWGLAFGAGVARLFGVNLTGAVAFFVFFLVCGALAGLAFVQLKAGATLVLIGASGGVSGLMGAASRVIERRQGLAPFTSPSVVGMAAVWLLVNVLVAMLGFAPGAGTTPIAWEAHLAGYAAGLLLVGPAARLLGRTHAPTD